MKKACTSYHNEEFEIVPNLQDVQMRSAIAVAKGATDLSNIDQARFIRLGIWGDKNFQAIQDFDNFGEPIEIIDGMSYQRQVISFTFDGSKVYAEVAAEFNFVSDDIFFIASDSSINSPTQDFNNGTIYVGDRITIAGSANNNGIFTVATVATNKVTFSEAIVDESASAEITIFTSGKGDITYLFGQTEHILDCTTGDGVGGRAKIELSLGSDTAPKENWVSVIESGINTVSLQRTDSEPSKEYGMICTAFVPSYATSIVNFYNSRRWTDAKEVSGRGVLATILSKLRDLKAYRSGAASNITIDTGPSPDSVDFTVASGEFKEIYVQLTDALQLSVDGAYVVNDPNTAYRPITDLNQITYDANNNTLNNKYFQVVVMISLNIDGSPDKLLINLPNGSYGSAVGAFYDTNGYSVTTLPAEFRSAYLLFAGVFKIQGGSVITNEALGFGVNNIDLRGQDLGSASSGSGTAAITEFSAASFVIFDDIDNTKEIAFQASGITTGTKRIFAVPDSNGTIGVLEVANIWSGIQDFNTGFDVGTSGTPITSIATGAADNDVMVTQGYVDDGLAANHLISNIAPALTLLNEEKEDTNGGRESKVIFRGTQSGGEESTLGEIEFYHHGASDDEKGECIIRVNNGSSITDRIVIEDDMLLKDNTGVTKIEIGPTIIDIFDDIRIIGSGNLVITSINDLNFSSGNSTTIKMALRGSAGTLYLKTVASGATQAAAGVGAGEIWKTAGHATLPDNVLMIGV